MTAEKQKVKFMYRQPDHEKHQSLTDVLDEIIITLRDIEKRISKLEETN